MPRLKKTVKENVRPALTAPKTFRSLGAVDLHIHGAFGIDIQTSDQKGLDRLAELLYREGYAAFCPTTLSAPYRELASTVQKLGAWISELQKNPRAGIAVPLGIHLEGPYLNPGARGAHPENGVRPFNLDEVKDLWSLSAGTLKILTLAPELVKKGELRRLAKWAKIKNVILSMGHSLASQEEALFALNNGFRNITHFWNAMPFHHRNSGIVGATLGGRFFSKPFVEVILDQIHVAPEVLSMTLKVLGTDSVCFVSDCVSAAETRVGFHRFGPLEIRSNPKGGCEDREGRLAGGSQTLVLSFLKWLRWQKKTGNSDFHKLLEKQIQGLTEVPLQSLNLNAKNLRNLGKANWRKLKWTVSKDEIQVDWQGWKS